MGGCRAVVVCGQATGEVLTLLGRTATMLVRRTTLPCLAGHVK